MELDPKLLDQTIALCPTGAITGEPFTLDMGRCLFCGECQNMMPNNIRFSRNWKLWSETREGLIVKADTGVVEPTITKHYSTFRNAINLRQVCAGGDGANEMELNAAGNVNFDMRHYGIEFTASPMHSDGIVLTGPITQKMAPYVERTYNAVPEPKIIVLVGTDAISGGMFADSTEIDRTFLDTVQPTLYIAGHPVHPQSFIGGIRELTGQYLPPKRTLWKFTCRMSRIVWGWICKYCKSAMRWVIQKIKTLSQRKKSASTAAKKGTKK